MKDIFIVQLAILNNFLYLFICQADKNIFWFQICMNNFTDSVQKVKPN